ncbi:hypothetical protein [Marivivens marinus]|uniref:hypothetical protein n=1 Tax=Marivivens marinus TaxID=3110173 RepID=UPI003B8467C8
MARIFWSSLFVCLSLFSPLRAEVLLPTEPRVRDVPRQNYLGERVGGIALFATTVFRLEDGEIIVLYGFIVGRPNGDSNFFYWNDRLSMDCEGKTVRNEDGSGVGQFLCDRDGRQFLSDSFGVVAEKYMRFRGDISGSFIGVNGQPIEVLMQWQGRERFPDPTPMIEALSR